LLGLDLKAYSVDYTFPLAYPDLNLESLIYLKRIRANIWTDYMIGEDVFISNPEPALVDRNYFTYGGDLLFDFNVFRIYFPFSMGARVSYNYASGEIIPEFLFTIDVN
jgi:hypothetical protein